MTLRKIAGALILCVIFAAIAITYSIGFGYWWSGPLILLAGLALSALIWFALWLMMGGD